MNAKRVLSCLNTMKDCHKRIVDDPGDQKAIEYFTMAYTSAYRELICNDECEKKEAIP